MSILPTVGVCAEMTNKLQSAELCFWAPTDPWSLTVHTITGSNLKESLQAFESGLSQYRVPLRLERFCPLRWAEDMLMRYLAHLVELQYSDPEFVFHWRSRHRPSVSPLLAINGPFDWFPWVCTLRQLRFRGWLRVKIIHDTIWQWCIASIEQAIKRDIMSGAGENRPLRKKTQNE